MLNFYESILHYKYSIPPTYFSHYCSHPQGGGWIQLDITKVREPMHIRKILSFNNAWYLTCTFY